MGFSHTHLVLTVNIISCTTKHTDERNTLNKGVFTQPEFQGGNFFFFSFFSFGPDTCLTWESG